MVLRHYRVDVNMLVVRTLLIMCGISRRACSLLDFMEADFAEIILGNFVKSCPTALMISISKPLNFYIVNEIK